MASSKPKTQMKLYVKLAVNLYFDADKQLHYGEVVVLKYRNVADSRKSLIHITHPKGYVNHYINGVIDMNGKAPLLRGLNRSLFQKEAKELASFLCANIGYKIEKDQQPKERSEYSFSQAYDWKSYFDQIGY